MNNIFTNISYHILYYHITYQNHKKINTYLNQYYVQLKEKEINKKKYQKKLKKIE